MPYLLLFSRGLLAIVFLVSAAGKLRSRAQLRAFTESLRAMKVLPAAAVGPVAGTVAMAELAVALLLVPLPTPAPTTIGFALAALLLGGFTVAIVLVLRRGVQASCRCFGASAGRPFGREHVVRNLVLLAFAVLGGYASLGDTAITGYRAVLALPPAALCALVVTRLDDLVALFAPVPSARR